MVYGFFFLYKHLINSKVMNPKSSQLGVSSRVLADRTGSGKFICSGWSSLFEYDYSEKSTWGRYKR